MEKQHTHRPAGGYQKMTLRMAFFLAAPNSWLTASVLPACVGGALALHSAGGVSPLLFCVLLLCCVLMHSTVNILNDYRDFLQGTDTLETSADPDDAILVYNRLNPRHVLWLALGCLFAAGVCGAYIVYRGGLAPLVIGLIGALITVCYSSGKLPLSHLPLSEVVSGFVMGGLIPLAVTSTLTGRLDFAVLTQALPCMVGIALLMNTNNTCDIERDTQSGRLATLPMLLGRRNMQALYRPALLLWPALTLLLGVWFFPQGAPALLALVAAIPLLRKQFALPLDNDHRVPAMVGIFQCNVVVQGGYLLCILLSFAVRALIA